MVVMQRVVCETLIPLPKPDEQGFLLSINASLLLHV